MVYGAILPSFKAAIIANLVTIAWWAKHIHYSVNIVPAMDAMMLICAVAAGVVFGYTSRVFSLLTQFIQKVFSLLSYPPLRPLIGGVILVLLFWLIGNTRYNGLGIPVILESFTQAEAWYVFLLKLTLTALTIGCGFKGGEVTPLFFIGAALGSFLSLVLPLPVALLAAMGFTAVFAGAANTPIACILMGIELSGMESGIYIAIACVMSYLFSGHSGIYHSQLIGHSKHGLLIREQGRSLSSLK
jgi:H+/Cl- antiporter ClcA